jgi:3-oxoacyl-[acyl-carrier-protein] synthase I
MPRAASRFGREQGPHICAATARNGLGFSPHQIWAFRRAELAAHAETPFRLPEGQRATMLHLRTMPPRSQGLARLLPLLRSLLAPLLGKIPSATPKPRLAVALALGERFAQGASRAGDSARQRMEVEVVSLAREAGHEARVVTVACGHASGAMAVLSLGADLKAGNLDVAIVGGIDTAYDALVVETLLGEGRLFDGEKPEGCIPGEGGAFLLLAGPLLAERWGWPRLAVLEAASTDEELPSTHEQEVTRAEAISRALRAVLDPLAAEGRRVDYWLSDLTHERWRVAEWQLALPRATVGVCEGEPTLEFLPAFLGDLGAATLPTAAVLATESFLRGDPRADTCLACASSSAGHRGVLLLSRPSR